MEEGSLLQNALAASKNNEFDNDGDNDNKNVLRLDVFSLDYVDKNDNAKHQRQHLLQLAKIAKDLNDYFQSKSSSYPWHYGCTPVFGICSTNQIAHVRAECRYGPSVADEWMAASLLTKWSKEYTTTTRVACLCWDVTDGQIILIQTAHVLPDWVDQDETDHHPFACWIVQGKIQLIHIPHVALTNALAALKKQQTDDSNPYFLPQIQQAWIAWLEHHQTQIVNPTNFNQRMPLVLPRPIAQFLSQHPTLVHVAIQAFCQYTTDKDDDKNKQKTKSVEAADTVDWALYGDDWVWTTCTVSRTNYAMLRTMVSRPAQQGKDHWTNQPNTIPPKISVVVKRYQRKYCGTSGQDSMTPHLQYAISCGVRILLGLKYYNFLIRQTNAQKQQTPVSVEQRVANWCDFVRTELSLSFQPSTHSNSGGDEEDPSLWILSSFQQGPNHAKYNLEHVLKCPTFGKERQTVRLYTQSQPPVFIPHLVKQLLNKVTKQQQQEQDDEDDYPIPQANQVDNDDWLKAFLQDDNSNNDTTKLLDAMLAKFQNFMVQPSGDQGVESSSFPATTVTSATSSVNIQTKPKTMEIRPRIFMNILHAVLKTTKEGSEGLEFPTEEENPTADRANDPYFYESDYAAMNEGDDNGDRGVANGSNGDEQITQLMEAMDQELQSRTNLSRTWDTIGDDDKDADDGENSVDDPMLLQEDGHVLVNLLKSLEASGGMPGPVRNMMEGMGAEVPESH